MWYGSYRTRKEAGAARIVILHQINTGIWIEPTSTTFGAHQARTIDLDPVTVPMDQIAAFAAIHDVVSISGMDLIVSTQPADQIIMVGPLHDIVPLCPHDRALLWFDRHGWLGLQSER
jgi:hypothetical protein